MEKEIKIEARKQYLRYFRVWFIIIGILAAIFLALLAANILKKGNGERKNFSAPSERVYDYADVLTDEEEQDLRDYIAQHERKYCMDIVLVTMNEPVEERGYWDTVMMNTADDFYDNNNYGYNMVHGDGVLLLDNWYEDENGSQKGSWLSTCGIAVDKMSNSDINYVLDVVADKVEYNPYLAYKNYVKSVCNLVDKSGVVLLSWKMILFLPVIIAVVFALINLRKSPAKDTTVATTYVVGGRPTLNRNADNFLRKNVTTRRIQSSSSGGGRSGGGGSHRSSSGVRHGGGGRRR